MATERKALDCVHVRSLHARFHGDDAAELDPCVSTRDHTAQHPIHLKLFYASTATKAEGIRNAPAFGAADIPFDVACAARPCARQVARRSWLVQSRSKNVLRSQF